MQNQLNDTIVAPITGEGPAAVSTIRISGKESISIASKLLSKDLNKEAGYTLHYAKFMDGDQILDEVVVALFKAPKSFTGEDVVEVSFHASPYILSRAITLCIENGAKMAAAGEFSMRAYLNGQLDLSQAEAIADLIASSSKSAHDLAMFQLKGAYSEMIAVLRKKLIRFAALLELELDFAEEDVEFADRTEFIQLIDEIHAKCTELSESFQAGNAIKSGIPVAIVGAPNAGKSTLLNCLLKENRAIVSEIAGTTRDTIEDTMNLGGHTFRFIDTAGIRDTADTIENLGIERSFESVTKASIILWLHDLSAPLTAMDYDVLKQRILEKKQDSSTLILVSNKKDIASNSTTNYLSESINISAQAKEGIDQIEAALIAFAQQMTGEGKEMLISNMRHFEAFQVCIEALEKAKSGLKSGMSTDIVAFEIREALEALGSITGEITNDDLLGTIFSEFCIGK